MLKRLLVKGMATTLKQRVFAGTLWMAVISLGQQVLAFVVQIVLARLLVPKDYGVVALVMTIGSFAVVFSTAGIATALVQRKELPRSIIDAAAVITGGIAIILGGVIFFSASWVSNFYGLPEMSFLLRLVAVDVFLKVMVSLYDSLMLRDMRYRTLSIMTFTSLTIQAVISILLASWGWGAKSLVIGYLCGSSTLLLMFVAATRYVPRSLGDFKSVGGVFRFGAWILLGRMANQAAMVLDQMVIARVLNATSLGLIDVSKKLAGIVPGTFLGFAGRVTLPVFSRWQDDLQRIEAAYWRGLRLNMLIVFPICVLVGLFSYQILSLLYGMKWLEGDILMKILAIQVAVVSIDAGYSSSVINAIGKPKFGTIVMVISLFLIPGFVYIGSFWGMVGVAWGMVAYGAVFFVVNQLVLRYLCRFRISRIPVMFMRALITVSPMLAGGIVLILCGALPCGQPPAVLSFDWFMLGLRTAGSALACLGVYFVTAYFIMRDDALFLWNGICGALKRK